MDVHDPSSRFDWLVGRTVAATFLVLLGGITLSLLAFELLDGIPGTNWVAAPAYLVYLGADVIQNPLLPGLGGIGHQTFIVWYLYALAIVIGNGYRVAHTHR